MQLFPRFEVHAAKVKDVGVCECCFYLPGELDVEELAVEITYIVEFLTGHVTVPVAKLCHQHMCDMASEIMAATPNSGWGR